MKIFDEFAAHYDGMEKMINRDKYMNNSDQNSTTVGQDSDLNDSKVGVDKRGLPADDSLWGELDTVGYIEKRFAVFNDRIKTSIN